MTRIAPADSTWTLAVLDSDRGFNPIGTAVAIDRRRAVTSAHVVLKKFDGPGPWAAHDPLWVAFPKVAHAQRQRLKVKRVEHDDFDPQVADVAVLHLEQDMPAGVTPARLKLIDAEVLRGQRWWAFGFPASSFRNGGEADGTVAAVLAHGWVQLKTESRYLVEPGFSGSGLWLPDYQAVGGIVGKALTVGNTRGDAQALSMAQIDVILERERLRVVAGWEAAEAGQAAMNAWGWGWQLSSDPERASHWEPRARGVTTDAQSGYRFRGRATALNKITKWLDRDRPDARVLVVTGSPGVGKSAVLGRVVTTADSGLRAQLPADDTAVTATVGSVHCAVHAKNKTALDVAKEIAGAALVRLPEHAAELPGIIRAALAERPRRFNIVIDALDEAHTPDDARDVIAEIIVPLAQNCGHYGAQVVCGTRRDDSAGDLTGSFAGAADWVDLDEPDYFQLADLQVYTLTTLQLHGEPRPGNPYADEQTARPVADRIAELAEKNFLVAGLEARSRGLYDATPADPDTLRLGPSVDDALIRYLQRMPTVAGHPADRVLTALAYAQAPGWPVELWHTATAALDVPVSAAELDRFARSAAASFLVETFTGIEGSQFRLFHQALNEALLRRREDGGAQFDQRRLTGALLHLGRTRGWPGAPAYLLRNLPSHAAQAGMLDELLTDDEYLHHADLPRLITAGQATTGPGRERLRILRLTPQAFTADPAHRAAMFSITTALEHLLPLQTTFPHPPYRARWATTPPRAEHAVLTGHTGSVHALCTVRVGDRDLLASAGDDRTVRLWNPAGTEHAVLTGHTGPVHALCTVRAGGRDLLASAGADRRVRLWDPATGDEYAVLTGHTGWVHALCALRAGDRNLLASADGWKMRLWDPATSAQHAVLTGRIGSVYGLCAVRAGGRDLLASAGDDQMVRLWDPATSTQHAVWDDHAGSVHALCTVRTGDRDLLASAGDDGTVRLRDPASGRDAVLTRHAGSVHALCAVRAGGRALLASAGDDRRVRLWDPASGRDAVLSRHAGSVHALCAVRAGGRALLASAGDDQMVRLWDLATGAEHAVLTRYASSVHALCTVRAGGRDLLATADDGGTVRLWDPDRSQKPVLSRYAGSVHVLCAVRAGGRALLASAGDDRRVRLWDPASGQDALLTRHAGSVHALCTVRAGGRDLLASAGDDQMVRLWDLATGAEHAVLTRHTSSVHALCTVRAGDRDLLAAADDGGTVRLWDPATGDEHAKLTGHTGKVIAMCAVRVGNRDLLAAADNNQTVRLWNLAARNWITNIPIHYPATCIAASGDVLTIGMSSGLIAIQLSAVSQ